jgi:hypothetical protein
MDMTRVLTARIVKEHKDFRQDAQDLQDEPAEKRIH